MDDLPGAKSELFYGCLIFYYFAVMYFSFQCCYTNFAGDICIGEVGKIKAKTLIVHGLKDPLVPLEHPDFLHQNIKGSR